MKLINYCPREIVLWSDDRSTVIRRIPAESIPLRIISVHENAEKIDKEIRVLRSRQMLNIGLPEKRDGVMYIVTQKVLEYIRHRFPHRDDFVSVDVDRYGIKATDGKIIGTTATFIRADGNTRTEQIEIQIPALKLKLG